MLEKVYQFQFTIQDRYTSIIGIGDLMSVAGRVSICLERKTSRCLSNVRSVRSTLSSSSSLSYKPSQEIRAGFRVRTRLDPDSIMSVDPDPYSESGSGSRMAKITHKSKKKIIKFHAGAGCSRLRAEGFICNLDVPYRGRRVGIL
jgi:hypothetical protein